MCIYLNLMILIKIIRGFISAWHAFVVSVLTEHDKIFRLMKIDIIDRFDRNYSIENICYPLLKYSKYYLQQRSNSGGN